VINKMDVAGRSRTPFLFAIDFEMHEGLFIENPLRQTHVLFDINGVVNAEMAHAPPAAFQFERYPENFETYKKRFDHVMEALRRGETSLLNLTIKTPIKTSLPLYDIFRYSKAKYRLYVPERFVCFSPERFVQIKNGKIFTHPMKGTIDAGLPNAAETLLNDRKEAAEHRTSIELISDDLTRVASCVKVNRFRYIDTLKTHCGNILQTSSEVEGTLPADHLQRLGTLLFKLLPAGSILGKPREATLRVTREAEQQPRGFYSGVAGYFDGEELDSGVLIRFIEQDGGELYFRSGGGITVDSQCEREYREAIQKVYLAFKQ